MSVATMIVVRTSVVRMFVGTTSVATAIVVGGLGPVRSAGPRMRLGWPGSGRKRHLAMSSGRGLASPRIDASPDPTLGPAGPTSSTRRDLPHMGLPCFGDCRHPVIVCFQDNVFFRYFSYRRMSALDDCRV